MIELIDIKSIDLVADWVELNVIYSSVPVSKAKLISLMEDNGYEDDQDYNGEELFDSILQELQNRANLYGENVPYRINDNVVEPLIDWQVVPEYVMCLLFSYMGASHAHAGTKLFERLSNEALKSYLNGEAITLGFPNTHPFKSQVDSLAILLHEQRGNRDPSPNDKDRGVDVIGWKPFNDGRNSQLIILMQCAAGRNWALKKAIPLSAWCQFIHWNIYTAIQCISITEIHSSTWQNRIDDYGLIFDRARIYRCLYDNPDRFNADLRGEILEWCREKLN